MLTLAWRSFIRGEEDLDMQRAVLLGIDKFEYVQAVRREELWGSLKNSRHRGRPLDHQSTRVRQTKRI